VSCPDKVINGAPPNRGISPNKPSEPAAAAEPRLILGIAAAARRIAGATAAGACITPAFKAQLIAAGT